MDIGSANPLYGTELQRIDGTKASLGDYAGKVLLIVNVASKCGLTPQYEGLEKLYADYRGRGLVVLGFPANNFKGQEPGTNEEISAFCRSTYGVDFPMFAKLSVDGDDQAPLYRLLTGAGVRRQIPANPRPAAAEKQGDKAVRWNFEKFLVSRSGKIVGRFDPDVVPTDPLLVGAIEKELAA
jgi:glutathione peroxidase